MRRYFLLPTPNLDHTLDILHHKSLAAMLGFAVAMALFPGRLVAFFTDNTNIIAALNFSGGSQLLYQFQAMRRYLAHTASSVSFVASRDNPPTFNLGPLLYKGGSSVSL